MLFGKLDAPGTYVELLRHPIWREALDWIRGMPTDPPIGIQELRGSSMYVNVHGYETEPREKRRYESHRRYVDLQYGIRGGELIDWLPIEELEPSDEYNASKDVRHYRLPSAPGATFWLWPGSFAIFFPGDGHMPKVSDGINARVDKLVIKIDGKLLK